MATEAEIKLLRRLVNETQNAAPWTDEYFGDLIDVSEDMRSAAAHVWTEKAAAYADLVDVQEGSSRRALGDLYEQALSMREIFSGDEGEVDTSTTLRPARTRPIERP